MQYFLWALMACQMTAWAWFQSRGGSLPDRLYLIFCVGMMLGQLGTSGECLLKHTWGTLVLQLYFFGFTLYGGIVRFRRMR